MNSINRHVIAVHPHMIHSYKKYTLWLELFLISTGYDQMISISAQTGTSEIVPGNNTDGICNPFITVDSVGSLIFLYTCMNGTGSL